MDSRGIVMDYCIASLCALFPMKTLDLEHIEVELKKRLQHPYKWLRKQNDLWDTATKFIYKTPDWNTFVSEMETAWRQSSFEKESFIHYAMNRWYNFWSAQAVEQIFTDLAGVAPNPKPLEDQYDFRWLGERFDLKTTVFPKGYGDSYAFAKANPAHLIRWFYENQSTEQRYHLKNRMFIVCYDQNGEHYKLKAEIGMLKERVYNYMCERTPADTFSLDLQQETETLADIIWATR